MALPKRTAVRYLLGLLVASGLFLTFAAFQLGGGVTPLKSLALASLLTAAGAAAFAFVWPARAWRWGVLLSSVFWLYLGVVFAAFTLSGAAEWWPLVDALVIVAVASMAAVLAGAVSRGTRGA